MKEQIQMLIAKYESYVQEDTKRKEKYTEEYDEIIRYYLNGRIDSKQLVIDDLKSLLEEAGIDDL